jgi:rhodanese-related sulfurtransferase
MSNEIQPADLAKLLEQEKNLALLDVRTPAEYEQVHVAEAKLMTLDQLNPEQLVSSGELSKEKPVYLLCQSGTRAGKAAQHFSKAGFHQPVVVRGGTLAWIEAGLPVIRGERRTISLERQVRIAAGALVFSGVLLGFFAHIGFFALSGFVGAGLIFAGITDWCGMGLLIAKAPWNQARRV